MAEISKITEELRLEKTSEIEKIGNVTSFKEKIEENLKNTITEITEIIFGGAINLESSDIHFEPRESDCRLRIRIDGILEDVFPLPIKTYEGILSRIKLLAGLKLNVTDRPQDGRFSIFFKPNEKPIEIRVSTLPSEKGEAVVARILNPKSLISLEELGLREDLLRTFRKEIQKPNGMIIVTGPTGAGKTTTLYAFLKEINKPELKIITIEDPIEYRLEGIQQTQVDPVHGYDFANGLKSIMRQDPDVILVGEIRDLETASIALQAALTGHLVFSTLHTNDAAGTVARLIALGEKPVNIAPALNMAVAQRLVRKVCKKCSKFEKPNNEESLKIEKALKTFPKGISIPKIDKIPKAVGCENCNFTGYRKRVGIFESFLFDDEMEKVILRSPSIAELREIMIKKGMVTMYQDGILKVLQGITTIEEVERVTSE